MIDQIPEELYDSADKALIRLERPATIKDIIVDGYEFELDTDNVDDVEVLEIIDRIENKGQVAAISALLSLLLGKPEYEKMKQHYIKSEGKFRSSKLQKVYGAIIEAFDPKALPSSK